MRNAATDITNTKDVVDFAERVRNVLELLCGRNQIFVVKPTS